MNNNTAGTDGSGIYNNNALSTIQNSTISNNTAVRGGGIYGDGELTVSYSTIAGNNATNRGGGIFQSFNSILKFGNSIIADNTDNAVSNPAPDFADRLTSQGYNLLENTSGATITETTTGNILGQDPQLMPLGSYGGLNNSIALLPTSPAIDAADPNNFPATDQRGTARPQDGDFNGSALPDIGAYERQLTIFTVTKTADTNDGVCDSDCSLREAISKTNAATIPDNAIVFDASLFSSPQTIILTTGQLLVQNNQNVFIKGPGADLLSISGNQLNRVFFFNINSKSVIEGLTITNGRETQGSGIWLGSAANLFINKCVIGGNTTTRFEGAGIYNNGGKILINDSKIINNTSVSKGGGLYGGGTTIINNSSFDNNSSMSDGGGIYIYGGFLTVNNSQINNNRAVTAQSSASSGGGIYLTVRH